MKTYEKLNTSQQNTVDSVYKHFGSEEVSQPEYIKYCQDNKLTFCFLLNKDYRVSKGLYKLPLPNQSKQVDIPEVKQEIIEQPQVSIGTTNNKAENIIPTKDETFVPFGHYKDIKNIIKSKVFYPSFITGLSGNGKTFNVQQSCAELKRELIRVNITIETDEDDLLGGFRLSDGKTVWHDGPVIDAMKRGAVLLLDEVDLASNKIMCLQPILEGQGVFLKKINQFVEPQPQGVRRSIDRSAQGTRVETEQLLLLRLHRRRIRPRLLPAIPREEELCQLEEARRPRPIVPRHLGRRGRPRRSGLHYHRLPPRFDGLDAAGDDR